MKNGSVSIFRRSNQNVHFSRTVTTRAGVTIIELFVVIAVVTILIAILLPAVQSARETARKTQCANNLKNIGVAILLHHDSMNHFPTGGWGYQWVGDPERGFGMEQPGGWIFNSLSFMEASAQHDWSKGQSGAYGRHRRTEMLAMPVTSFVCPSRRRVQSFPYTENNYPLRNANPPMLAAKSDYAINAGDRYLVTRAGPATDNPADVRAYGWPSNSLMNGISFVRSQIRMAQVRDGLTNTLLVGEKRLLIQSYSTGMSPGDDQTMYLGDDADIRRWADSAPLSDRAVGDDYCWFGSIHPGGCEIVMCDGGVRTIAFGCDPLVFSALGNRADRIVSKDP